MIEPDVRESIWYDINNVLNMEPDKMPHYWGILLSKFQLIEDNNLRRICTSCNSTEQLDITKNKKAYCMKDKQHKISEETAFQSCNRIIDRVLEVLREPSNNCMDLFDLESWLFGKEEDDYFETMYYGDITKSQVKKMMFQVKKVMMEKLVELRDKIRFSATMRTPSIQVH